MLTYIRDYIAALDGETVIEGGWIQQHWIQIAWQAAAVFAGAAYSFVLTGLILFVLNRIPGFKLRVTPQEEIFGIDDIEIGEFAVCAQSLLRRISFFWVLKACANVLIFSMIMSNSPAMPYNMRL